MQNRRDFIRYSAVALAASTASMPLLAAHHEKLPTRTIPGTDESLPIIGLGNSPAFGAEDVETTTELIDIFTARGGAYVDVGGSSGPFVSRIGEELGVRDQLFLGNYVDPDEEPGLRKKMSDIARAQGSDALDLAHTRQVGEYRERVSAYRQMKDEGLVRYTGIARSGKQNFDAIMQLIEAGLVDFIQINYSLLEPEAAEQILPMASDHGVAVNINRPFINGQYFGIVSGKALPEWAQEFDCESWAQFSLKFILAHPAVNCVLTETSNPRHAIDNIGAGFGELPDKKMQQRMMEHMRGIV